MNTHKHARLTFLRRLEMVQQLIAHQVCVPEAARAYGVTAPTVRKWLGRFLAQGQAGLADASSRPTVSPRAIAPAKALAIVELRRKRLTQARIAQALGVSASTVSRVLARAGLSHLADLEPAEPVVRYEHQAPGDLLHIDIKKLGRIQRPGHRVTGNRRDTVEGAGWDFVFVAIDDHARVAFTDIHPDERFPSAVQFLKDAVAYYQRLGVTIQRLLTDNGSAFRSRAFAALCHELGIKHRFTRPYRPQTNGKAERFIQSALREWAYAHTYQNSQHRADAMKSWLHHYNWHRPHQGIGRAVPISRLNLDEYNLLTVHSYLADRYGTARVVAGGALLYVAGLLLTTVSDGRLSLTLSAGVLVGLGLAGTAWTVNGVVGRRAPAARRSAALGAVSAMGALGQFVMLPLGMYLIGAFGWQGALGLCAAVLACMAPLAWLLREAPRQPSAAPAAPATQSGGGVRAALGNRDLWLLWLGFMACGFHLAFIATHLPAYLADKGIGGGTAALALGLVGLFNIAGTFFFGLMGERYPKKYVLAFLYLVRTAVITVYFLAPVSQFSTLLFASAMGFLWLGTAPVTTGLVAQLFGLGTLSTLFGVVFLGHQVGSFLGVWLGGVIFDLSGSYDAVWLLSIAIGLFSAAMHLPVREPARRLAAAAP
ncbi:IS481 family transposase [Bordetella pertussis]|nr:IS481 family transposase [Bordetella pertussis]